MFESPRTASLCVKLTGGDHKAGMLLHRTFELVRFMKATIPHKPGTWIAHDREWWCREVQLSLRQCDRALALLEQRGLIEREQWYWENRLILYVRSTTFTLEFLRHPNMTWELADAMCDSLDDVLKSGKPGLPNMASLVCQNWQAPEVAENGNPGLPNPAISIKQKDKQKEIQKGKQADTAYAKSASKSASLSGKQVSGKAYPDPDMKYDPPAHPSEVVEESWQHLPEQKKASALAKFETAMTKYNAFYTSQTGKAPPA